MEELFRKYTAAFDAFDPVGIAELYRMPCAIADADGVHIFTERDALTDKFSANCEAMRNFGFQCAQFNVLEKQELGTDKVAVTIGWRILTASSNIDFRSLYICHRVENAWYIFSANVYEGSFSNET